jgi:hypothetical protein
MSAARVTRDNAVIALDRAPQLDERVTEEDVKDAGKLSRLLMRILKDIASLKRRFYPRRRDFEDRAITGAGSVYRFEHRFGGRVRWWISQWKPASTAGNYIPLLAESSQDGTTLVLTNVSVLGINAFTGTVTIRVEEAG